MPYHGWKNKETYNVAQWIDSDKHTYELRQAWAQAAWDGAASLDLDSYEEYIGRNERARITLALTIKEYIADKNPLAGTNSPYNTLLSAAMNEVDYYEIAMGSFLE